MQDCYNVQKLVHITYHPPEQWEQNPEDYLSDIQKAFDKHQQYFLITRINKLEIENFFHSIKSPGKKYSENQFNDGKLKAHA